MSTTPGRERAAKRATADEREAPLHAFLLLAGFLAFVATRWFHPVQGFGNQDIAGILYNADLLNDGLVPYRDSAEMKPPGTFFLVAAVFHFARSLDVLQIAYAIWLALGAPAIAIAAGVLYEGDRKKLARSAAVALYLLTIGAFEMNYSAWMSVAYVWSFAMLLVGLLRGRWHGHLLAGVFGLFAYLLKVQAVVLAPLFLLLWWWSKRRGDPGATAAAFAWWALGAAIGLSPIFAFYAVHGAIPELLPGIFPVATGVAYSADRTPELNLLWRVPGQMVKHVPLLIALGTAAVVGVQQGLKAGHRDQPPIVPQLVFWVASLAGCALGGFRFYLHYLPQCVPALVLLAAHPAGFRWLLAPRDVLFPRVKVLAARGHVVVAAGLVVFLLGRIPFGLAHSADFRVSPMVEAAGQMIRSHTTPDDRILVWGWPAWGTYYFADRRSPSVVFKVLGQLTDFNNNSAWSPVTNLHFRDGPLAQRLLGDMKDDPPAYFVRATPFVPRATSDPLEEFADLRDLVARDYVRVARFGNIDVYERRERIRKQ